MDSAFFEEKKAWRYKCIILFDEGQLKPTQSSAYESTNEYVGLVSDFLKDILEVVFAHSIGSFANRKFTISFTKRDGCSKRVSACRSLVVLSACPLSYIHTLKIKVWNRQRDFF